ncbi:MAG: trimeric autotransporter adhesin, partial [Solirubrobacteraceae bacterium]|nr:trimeric autotransporter adhesin [Solirubrobacteraceae bacterium]
MALILRSSIRPAVIAIGAIVALFLSLAPAASAADPTFSRSNFATGNSPISIAAGDLNGDLRPDLVTANDQDNNVTVLFADAFGGFTGPLALATGAQPRDVAIADFNGDGNPDLAVANGNQVSIMLGDGLGGFATAVGYATPGEVPVGIVAGDFNQDGRRDVALANVFTGLSVMLGDGAG